MTAINKVFITIVLIQFGIIVFLRECSPGKSCPPSLVSTKPDTIWRKADSIGKPYKPEPKPIGKANGKVKLVYVRVDNPVDTEAVIAAYYTARYYSDTAKTQYGDVVINDTVSKNAIASRQLVYNLTFPVITQPEIVQPRNQFYGGFNLGGTNTWIDFGGSLTLRTKTNKIYRLSTSYTTQKQFYFQVGSDFLIHF